MNDVQLAKECLKNDKDDSKFGCYVVRDRVSDTATLPFYFSSDEVAKRAFFNSLKGIDFPEDKILERIGDYSEKGCYGRYYRAKFLAQGYKPEVKKDE